MNMGFGYCMLHRERALKKVGDWEYVMRRQLVYTDFSREKMIVLIDVTVSKTKLV